MVRSWETQHIAHASHKGTTDSYDDLCDSFFILHIMLYMYGVWFVDFIMCL
jgi:hypothetical protein